MESILQGPKAMELFQNLYGNEPKQWDNALTGWPRIRFIINCLTRMRFCTPQGSLDLTTKGAPEQAPSGYIPWFSAPDRALQSSTKIAFGHWAALEGKTQLDSIFALDTGCVWGNCLTALRLDDKKQFQVACAA